MLKEPICFDDKTPIPLDAAADIEFCNFSFSYNSRQSAALCGINICINGGEKIGIAGRTGAGLNYPALFRQIHVPLGKSSIVNALLQLFDGNIGGSIRICGRDISTISLIHRRSAFILISQVRLGS